MIQFIQSYEILSTIGGGGMGIVYKAKHKFRKELYAIKSLANHLTIHEDIRERFRREAVLLSELDHKNIVKVYDFIEDSSGLHIVMEYIEGRTLDKMIGKEIGPIPYQRALPLFEQMIDALEYAHSKGVIHRDIKPSNIMVTQNNEVKLMDFGIAKIGGTSMTKTGTKMGTLYYMSPEAIKGEKLDERTDIYSLGVTLYEMLAGRLPLKDSGEETSEFVIMNKIMTEELADPRNYYPPIPENLVKLVNMMTEKEKDRRIKEIREVKKELGVIKADRQIKEDQIKKHREERQREQNKEIGEQYKVKELKQRLSTKKKYAYYGIAGVILIIILTVIIINSLSVKEIKGIKELKTLSGHSSTVTSVAFSPDGKYLASGSWDNTIKLWEVESGREIKTLSGHSRNVLSVAFSPDSKYIASGSFDKINTKNKTLDDLFSTLIFFNLLDKKANFETFYENFRDSSYRKLLYNMYPGYQFLGKSPSDMVVIYQYEIPKVDINETSPPKIQSTNPIISIDKTTTQKETNTMSGKSISKLWEVESGKEIMTLNEHEFWVSSVNFSPNGKYLASGGGDNTIKLWEIESGSVIRTIRGHESGVNSVAFSPDGKYLVSGSNDRSIKLWEVESGGEIRTLLGHESGVISVAFSPDGKIIASGSWDNTIKLWEVESGKIIMTLNGHEAEVNSVTFSPDGKYLASASKDETIKLWEVQSGNLLRTLRGHANIVWSVTFSPNGKYLASGGGDGAIKLWEMRYK